MKRPVVCKASYLSLALKGCRPRPCKSGNREGSVACTKSKGAGLEDARAEELTTPLQAKLNPMVERGGCGDGGPSSWIIQIGQPKRRSIKHATCTICTVWAMTEQGIYSTTHRGKTEKTSSDSNNLSDLANLGLPTYIIGIRDAPELFFSEYGDLVVLSPETSLYMKYINK